MIMITNAMIPSFSVSSSILLFFLFGMLLKAPFAVFLSPEDVLVEVLSAVSPGVIDRETNARNQ